MANLIVLVTRELPCIILICKTGGLSSVTADFTFLWRVTPRLNDGLLILFQQQSGRCVPRGDRQCAVRTARLMARLTFT